MAQVSHYNRPDRNQGLKGSGSRAQGLAQLGDDPAKPFNGFRI
jgi:hypothetical protein